MASSSSVPTSILVLSDTHAALPDPVKWPNLSFSQVLPAADVAIHCGDLTSCGRYSEHERALTLLKSLPAPIKIVIPGNHDMTLDSEYMLKNRRLHGWNHAHSAEDLGDALALYRSQEAWDAGIRYMEEGLRSFVLPNGAKLTVYVSAYTPEFCNWAFAYPDWHDRFNIVEDWNCPENPVPDFVPQSSDPAASGERVTVMITHGPPYGILDVTIHGENVGCYNLLNAVSRCRPLLHCFGHIHEAWGVDTRMWHDQTGSTAATALDAVQLPLSGEPSNNIVSESRGDGDLTQPQHKETSPQYEHESSEGQARADLKSSGISVSHPQKPLNSAAAEPDHEQVAASIVDATAIKHGEQTVFLNASIMDVQYVPRQRPWLVRIGLPQASSSELEHL